MALGLGFWLIAWVVNRGRTISGTMSQAEALAIAEGRNILAAAKASPSGWNEEATSHALAAVRAYIMVLMSVGVPWVRVH